MTPEPDELPTTSPKKFISIGLLCSNVFAIAATLIGSVFVHGSRGDIMIFSLFILIPLVMGIIASFCWNIAGLKVGGKILWSIANTVIAIGLSALTMREGWGCLLIVSPLILIFMLLGVMLGTWLQRWQSSRLNISVAMILTLMFLFDITSDHSYQRLVSDTITIDAPPERVWQYVVSFPEIEKEPTYWFFQLGLPMPKITTSDGRYRGAARKCIFSNGLVFDEVISTYEPNRDLVFDVVSQPADPEILGHITCERGEFLLHDNGDGTTSLTGNSWYRLHIFPAWYFDLWASSIMRNVHVRVMEHIQMLAEGEPGGS